MNSEMDDPEFLTVKVNDVEYLLMGGALLSKLYASINHLNHLPSARFCKPGMTFEKLQEEIHQTFPKGLPQKNVIFCMGLEDMFDMQPPYEWEKYWDSLTELFKYLAQFRFGIFLVLIIPSFPILLDKPELQEIWDQMCEDIQYVVQAELRRNTDCKVIDKLTFTSEKPDEALNEGTETLISSSNHIRY